MRSPNPLDFHPRKTDVVTMSLLFIDGEDTDSARLLITPIPWKVEGGNRPSFLVPRKQHTRSFDIYWNAYNRLFNSSLSKDI